MNNPEKNFKDFKVGESAEFSEIISQELVNSFAQFSGDVNPLHTDQLYAQATPFGGTIAHGMIAGALFSRLIGMYLPGKYALYLRQSLDFRLPIKPGTEVVVKGVVVHKTDSANLLLISTMLTSPDATKVYVSGEAAVKVLK